MTYSPPTSPGPIRKFAATSAGFAILLAVLIGVLLVGVGFRADTLPFRPGADYSDAAISHWPNALFLQRSIQAGNFPLWRPLLMSGQPFAANPLNKVWYPFQWLAILLPPALHLNLLVWLHLTLAGLGMRAFIRRLGLSIGAASLAGIAYGLTPRLWAAVGGGHLDILYAAAWFPWVLWAVHYAIIGWAGQSPLRGRAILGIVCALAFLADIRLSVFIFGTGAALGVWLLFINSPGPQRTANRRGAFVALIVAGGLALGLTAVQWLPLIELAPYLTRGGLTSQDAGVFSLQPLQLIGAMLPRQGGNHETETYVGLFTLISCIIGSIGLFRAQRRQFALWACLILFAAMYALGDRGFLWPALIRLFPPLLWLRVPPRIWIVVVVGVIVLAAYGVESLATIKLPRRSPLFPIWKPALIIAIACIVMVLDLAWTDITRVEGRPPSQWLDAYQPIAQALKDDGLTRVYSPSYSLPQQIAAYWNIPDFGGVDPFQIRSYVAAFEAASGVQAAGYSVTLPAFNAGDFATANRTARLNADLLAQWDVSHVLSAFPIDDPALRLVTQVQSVYIYRNLRLTVPLVLSWDDPNHLKIDNTSGQAVKLAPRVPGWLESEAGDRTAIEALAGQTLDITYRPASFIPSVILGLLSIILTGGLIMRQRSSYRTR